MPTYAISGVDVAASYDAVSGLPGAMRPVPAMISDHVAEVLTQSIDLQQVISAAIGSVPISASSLTSVAAIARQRVQDFINQGNITDALIATVTLDATSPYYRETSTGTHETVSWMIKKDSEGNGGYWGFSIQIQGQTVSGYACLVITLQEVGAS